MLADLTAIDSKPRRGDPDDIVCWGITHQGRFVIGSGQETYMRIFHSHHGIPTTLAHFLDRHGVKEIDYIMPRTAFRIRLFDVLDAPHAFFEGEEQYFPHELYWEPIVRYVKPNNDTAKQRETI